MESPAAQAGPVLAPASHLSVSTRSLLSGSFRFLKKQSEGEFSAGTSRSFHHHRPHEGGSGEVPLVGVQAPSPKATCPSPDRPTWLCGTSHWQLDCPFPKGSPAQSLFPPTPRDLCQGEGASAGGGGEHGCAGTRGAHSRSRRQLPAGPPPGSCCWWVLSTGILGLRTAVLLERRAESIATGLSKEAGSTKHWHC